MKGIFTPIIEYRRKVFAEVAKFAFENLDYTHLDNIPYNIVKRDQPLHRSSIFLERAVVSERTRLALGLPLRTIDEHSLISHGINDSLLVDNYYDDAFINIIKFACNSCPDNVYKVSDMCRGCLARPCTIVCPKKAVSMQNGKAFIDQDLCIKCGKCKTVCPYGSIFKMERPCSKVCGMDAIGSDELGRADIDYDKCVSCGVCISNCPFGAISDKSQIYQLIKAISRGEKIIAEIAPAFVGQFGAKVTPEKLKKGMKEIGFHDVYEVAIGADLCTVEEAHDFLEKVPSEISFLATSCCPSWSLMTKKLFPECAENISMAMTPMVLTARFIKKENPDAKVVFIGPCVAKKLEATRSKVKSHVDYVLTFEEMMAIFDAKNIDLANIETNEELEEGTGSGRRFAVSGGVADAVKKVINDIDPDREVLIDSANGLKECRQMLTLAKKGKRQGYLLEGMACPGGCVAGTGTLQAVSKSTTQVNKYSDKANMQVSSESRYVDELAHLDSNWFDDWEMDWD